jgi:hypothetical protein
MRPIAASNSFVAQTRRYPTGGRIYPKQREISIELETVVSWEHKLRVYCHIPRINWDKKWSRLEESMYHRQKDKARPSVDHALRAYKLFEGMCHMLSQRAEFGEVWARQDCRGFIKESRDRFIHYDLVHLSVVAHTLVGDLV